MDSATWHCDYECFNNLREDDVLRMQPAEVQHVLKQHANRAVDKTNNQRVNVRRRELLKDAFRQFKRTSLMLRRCCASRF